MNKLSIIKYIITVCLILIIVIPPEKTIYLLHHKIIEMMTHIKNCLER